MNSNATVERMTFSTRQCDEAFAFFKDMYVGRRYLRRSRARRDAVREQE